LKQNSLSNQNVLFQISDPATATPLETGTRQRTDAEKQRAAKAKVARVAALAKQDRERQQRLLRDAQELNRSIGSKLHEAIGNRDADLIRSYHRALNSGIARAQEAATREATPGGGTLT
jgi:Skp family chaperone for outer membrane proteins